MLSIHVLYMLSIHVLYMLSIRAVYIGYIYAVYTCSIYTVDIRCLYVMSIHTQCLLYTCYVYMLSIHAIYTWCVYTLYVCCLCMFYLRMMWNATTLSCKHTFTTFRLMSDAKHYNAIQYAYCWTRQQYDKEIAVRYCADHTGQVHCRGMRVLTQPRGPDCGAW